MTVSMEKCKMFEATGCTRTACSFNLFDTLEPSIRVRTIEDVVDAGQHIAF